MSFIIYYIFGNPLTYVVVSGIINTIQYKSKQVHYNFTPTLILIIVISYLHVILETVIISIIEYLSAWKVDNTKLESLDNNDKFKDHNQIATFVILLIIIAGILSISWSISLNPKSKDSTPQHNDLTYETSSFDYFCIWIYTTLIVLMNHNLKIRLSHYIQKFQGYQPIFNSITKIDKYYTIYDIEEQFLHVKYNKLRDFLVIKTFLNAVFAIVLLIASYVFVSRHTIDTTYMFQLTISSFLICSSASKVIDSHDNIIDSMIINIEAIVVNAQAIDVESLSNDYEVINKQKDILRKLILVNNEGILKKAVYTYTIAIINVITVLLGLASLNETLPKLL